MTRQYIGDITPLDEDIVLITSWLAKELNEAEAAAVEQRLREDDAFWVKAGPIVKLWRMKLNYGELLAKYAAEPATQVNPAPAADAELSEWARATAAAIVRGVDRESLPRFGTRTSAAAGSPKAPAAATPVVPTASAAPLPRGERIFRWWFGWAGEGGPKGPGNYWARAKYMYATMIMAAFGYDRRVNPPETAIEKSDRLSLIWTRVEQSLAFVALGAVVMTFGLGFYASYRDGDDSSLIRRAVHVFTRPPLTGGTKIQTAPGQEVALTLPSGTRATVRASSMLQWNAVGVVLLQGDATFEVPAAVREQRVLTDYGDVRMGPGQYALARGGEDGKLVLISVAAGLATIRADTTATSDTAVVTLGPGEFGELSSWGTAAKMAPHVAQDHPRFVSDQQVLRPTRTPSGAPAVVRWRSFSWVRLAPGSRLTWDARNPAVVHLSGEMAIVLDPRDGLTRVQTDADHGDVILDAGSHALKTVIDAGFSPVVLVSTRGAPSRIVPRPIGPTPTDAIVEKFGLESGRVRTRMLTAADYPELIPDSLAPRTPFGGARGRARNRP